MIFGSALVVNAVAESFFQLFSLWLLHFEVFD